MNDHSPDAERAANMSLTLMNLIIKDLALQDQTNVVHADSKMIAMFVTKEKVALTMTTIACLLARVMNELVVDASEHNMRQFVDQTVQLKSLLRRNITIEGKA